MGKYDVGKIKGGAALCLVKDVSLILIIHEMYNSRRQLCSRQ